MILTPRLRHLKHSVKSLVVESPDVVKPCPQIKNLRNSACPNPYLLRSPKYHCLLYENDHRNRKKKCSDESVATQGVTDSPI